MSQLPSVYATELKRINKLGLPVAISYNGGVGAKGRWFCWTIQDAEEFLEVTKFLHPGAKITIKKIEDTKP